MWWKQQKKIEIEIELDTKQGGEGMMCVDVGSVKKKQSMFTGREKVSGKNVL